MSKILACTLVGSLLVCAAPRASAQAPPAFKASVDLVPISVIVHDPRGRVITTLSAADFEVRDNGQPRPILTFQTDDQSPVTVAVLVDVSGSMRVSSKLAVAREVVKQLAADLRDGLDEAGLFTFDSALHEQHDFTSHPALIDEALDRADPWGETSLYDAIAGAARRLSSRPAPRRAIVVLTDGVDTSSTLAPSEVSALASSIDVPVYVVATTPRIDRAIYAERAAARPADAAADLADLALWTGGRLLWVTGSGEASFRAHEIVTELRHRYLLAIDAAGSGEWRPIDVRVRGHHFSVRARSGYFGRRSGDSSSR